MSKVQEVRRQAPGKRLRAPSGWSTTKVAWSPLQQRAPATKPMQQRTLHQSPFKALEQRIPEVETLQQSLCSKEPLQQSPCMPLEQRTLAAKPLQVPSAKSSCSKVHAVLWSKSLMVSQREMQTRLQAASWACYVYLPSSLLIPVPPGAFFLMSKLLPSLLVSFPLLTALPLTQSVLN